MGVTPRSSERGPVRGNQIDRARICVRTECSSVLVAGPGRLLDVAEAAATLGLKFPSTLYKWAYAGRIPSVRNSTDSPLLRWQQMTDY